MSKEPSKTETQTNFQERIDAFLAKNLAKNRDLTSTPPPKPPGSIPQNLPWTRAENFVGREEPMNALHQKLQKFRRAIVTNGGILGAGTTELALQYAHRHLQLGTYPGGICWIWGRDRNVSAAIVRFAKSQLNLNPPENLSLIEQNDYCWRNWQGGDALLIFDNVEHRRDIQHLLPPAKLGFKVLVTTDLEYFDKSFKKLKLPTLSEETALELLVSFIGEARIQGELKEAKRFCASLGFLPLGLELAGRYLQRKPELSFATTCQQLKWKRLEALERHRKNVEEIYKELGMEDDEPEMSDDRRAVKLFHDYTKLGDPAVEPPEVMTTEGTKTLVGLILAELKDLKAREFAYLLSLLAGTPIPYSLLPILMPSAKEEDLENWRDSELFNFGLLQRADSESAIMADEVQEFVGVKLLHEFNLEDNTRNACRAIAAIGKAMPDKLTDEEIAAIAPVMPHLAQFATLFGEEFEEEELIWPFVGLAKYCCSEGLYDLAEDWLEQGLVDVEDAFESPNLDRAFLLNYLAGIYCHQQRYEEAKPLYLEALEMRKELLGRMHPDVATSQDNLACLYRSQGRYAEAEPLYLQALSIFDLEVGEEHPDDRTVRQNYREFLEQVARENRQGELSDERSLRTISEMESVPGE